MFSPVSQISIPSSPFFSLSPPFISSFTPFHHFGIFNTTVLFQLKLGLSMDSTTFVISLISLSSSITSSSISPFISPSSINLGYNSLTSLPSDVFHGLFSLNHLSSFLLHSNLTNIHIILLFPFIPTVSPPFLQVFLKVLTTWLLSFHFSFLPFLIFVFIFSSYLAGNKLTTLPSGVFSNLNNLESL